MSDNEDCCVKALDDGWHFGWDEGAKFMLRSVAELIGNAQYDSSAIWHWISKEMKTRNFGTWKTDRGILGFHIRVDEE